MTPPPPFALLPSPNPVADTLPSIQTKTTDALADATALQWAPTALHLGPNDITYDSSSGPPPLTLWHIRIPD